MSNEFDENSLDPKTLEDEMLSMSEAIELAEKSIELGKAMERLKENKDFKLVIEESYLKTEAEELFKTLSGAYDLSKENEADILVALKAKRDLVTYLGDDEYVGTVIGTAMSAPQLIEELKAEKSRLEMLGDANGVR